MRTTLVSRPKPRRCERRRRAVDPLVELAEGDRPVAPDERRLVRRVRRVDPVDLRRVRARRCASALSSAATPGTRQRPEQAARLRDAARPSRRAGHAREALAMPSARAGAIAALATFAHGRTTNAISVMPAPAAMAASQADGRRTTAGRRRAIATRTARRSRCSVDYKRLNTFFADYTKNISKGGTFIRTSKPLDVGTEFVFVLTVPDRTRRRSSQLNGEVDVDRRPRPTRPTSSRPGWASSSGSRTTPSARRWTTSSRS